MLNNTFLWLTVYFHYFHEGHSQLIDMGRSRLPQIVALILLAGGIPLMALSRVYLGAHTLNQVLFGTLIGSLWASIGHFKVKPIFLQLPATLYSLSEEGKYAVDFKTYLKALNYSLIIPMAIAVTTLTFRWSDSSSSLYGSEAWMKRMHESGCSKD